MHVNCTHSCTQVAKRLGTADLIPLNFSLSHVRWMNNTHPVSWACCEQLF